jgi:hypothetical protein
MTKADMMDRLDDVFTDRRLDRATVRCAIGARSVRPRLSPTGTQTESAGGSSRHE